MGPQNHHDGQHADDGINDFTVLLDNRQDAMHRVTIYNGMQACPKHKSRNRTDISDEQLQSKECCIFHSIEIHVEGLEGERISKVQQWTGSQRWR